MYPEAVETQHCHFDPSAWQNDGELTYISMFIAKALTFEWFACALIFVKGFNKSCDLLVGMEERFWNISINSNSYFISCTLFTFTLSSKTTLFTTIITYKIVKNKFQFIIRKEIKIQRHNISILRINNVNLFTCNKFNNKLN